MALKKKLSTEIRSTFGIAAGVALSAFLVASPAFADRLAAGGYGGPVKSGSGECWSTSGGLTGPIEACGDEMPKLEVVATETAATMTATVLEKITFAATMLFAFDSAELSSDAKAVIDERIQALRGRAKLTSEMRIEGHADSTGPESYNEQLSTRRAQAVADYITANSYNVKASDIEVVGMGESKPVASNATAAGRAQNRRVDIFAKGEMLP